MGQHLVDQNYYPQGENDYENPSNNFGQLAFGSGIHRSFFFLFLFHKFSFHNRIFTPIVVAIWLPLWLTRGLLVLVRYFSEVHDATQHQHTRCNYQDKDYHWMHWQEGYQRPYDEVPSDRPSYSQKLSHLFLLPGCIPLKLKLSHEVCCAIAGGHVVNG